MELCFLLLCLGVKNFVYWFEKMRIEDQGQVLAKCFNALPFVVFSHFLQLIIADHLKVTDSLILLILSSRYINTLFCF